MKRICEVGFLIIFILLYFLIQTDTAGAYELDWHVIQHRVYESQENINRLAFEIKDDSGDYVDSKSAVTNVVLKYPDGNTVSLGELMFELYEYYWASFNPDNSEWTYASPKQLSDYFADIKSPLVVGTYTLEVTMENGQLLTSPIDFDFLVDLPAIHSRTFQIHTDSTGNVHWTWQIPDKLLALANDYDLRVRPGLMAMSGGEMVALFFPNLPVEVGYSLVPSSIYQDFINQADEIRFTLQVRTSNNNARAYSKSIIIGDPSTTVSVLPQKTVVVIPMN